MSITVAGIEFEHHHYDPRGDVLYLSVAAYKSAPPVDADATPEGHGVEYDAGGHVVALTLVNVKRLMERDGELKITWPEAHVRPDELLAVLAAA